MAVNQAFQTRRIGSPGLLPHPIPPVLFGFPGANGFYCSVQPRSVLHALGTDFFFTFYGTFSCIFGVNSLFSMWLCLCLPYPPCLSFDCVSPFMSPTVNSSKGGGNVTVTRCSIG